MRKCLIVAVLFVCGCAATAEARGRFFNRGRSCGSSGCGQPAALVQPATNFQQPESLPPPKTNKPVPKSSDGDDVPAPSNPPTTIIPAQQGSGAGVQGSYRVTRRGRVIDREQRVFGRFRR